MIRVLISASAVALLGASAASATTTIINFSAASCTGGCVNGTLIDQTVGDTANVNVSYRAPGTAGNGTTSEASLRYWQNSYSNSDAVYAQSGIGEVRFDVLSAGTLTLNSVGLGGWPNTVRNIQVRVYDLSYTLLSSAAHNTTPPALLDVALGQNSTAGLIFQFGIDGFNGGIQNLSFTFDNGVGGVPEPASWAMMIAGFGLTGAAMRRRRSAIA